MKVAFAVRWIPVLLCVCRLNAQPVVYQATGTREQVQAAVTQFEHDIVYGATGDAQPPSSDLGSYRVATLDDVPPGSGLNDISAGGLSLQAGAGALLFVGDNDGATFSPPHSLSLTTAFGGSNFVMVYVPSNPERSSQNAFGAVFANVPPGSAALEINHYGSWSRFEAQPATDVGQFSFIGVINHQQVFSITDVRVNATLSMNGTGAPGADAGIVDQIILGSAVPLPEPTSLQLLMAAAVVVGATWILGLARARFTNG